MENVRKLEVMVASWYKNMPHLPKNGQKWLADNVWWIVLVWVVLGAMGVGGVIMATFFAGALLSSVGSVGAAIGGIAFVAVVIAMLFSIVILVLSGMAIAPLRALKKKGWTLLFVVILLEVAAHAISFLLGFNLFALVSNLLFTAVGAYFLFEIRDLFVAGRAKKADVKKKA